MYHRPLSGRLRCERFGFRWSQAASLFTPVQDMFRCVKCVKPLSTPMSPVNAAYPLPKASPLSALELLLPLMPHVTPAQSLTWHGSLLSLLPQLPSPAPLLEALNASSGESGIHRYKRTVNHSVTRVRRLLPINRCIIDSYHFPKYWCTLGVGLILGPKAWL